MKKIMALIVLGIIIPKIGLSGGAEGNGGGIVHCKQADGKETYEVLDYYEARTSTEFIIDLGPSEPVEKKLGYFFDRLKKLDPERAKKWKQTADQFLSKVVWVEKLNPIPDQGAYYLEPHCILEQAASQKRFPLPHELPFQVSKRLWEKLDNTNKAGLILHEVIYGEAIDVWGATNSHNARYLHELLASHLASSLSLKDYIEALRDAGFQSYRYGQALIRTSETEFYPSDNISKAYTFKTSWPSLPLPSVGGNQFLEGATQWNSISFYESGAIFQYYPAILPSSLPSGKGILKVGSNQLQIGFAKNENYFNFYESGALHWYRLFSEPGTTPPSTLYHSNKLGKDIPIKNGAEFSEKGELVCVVLGGEIALPTTTGKIENFSYWDHVKFNQDQLAEKVDYCDHF